MFLVAITVFATLALALNTLYSALLTLNYSFVKKVYESMLENDIFLVGSLTAYTCMGPAYYIAKVVHRLPYLFAKLLMLVTILLFIALSGYMIDLVNSF
ncbi:hypothetical protein HPB58_23410 [Priestia filamentosa]|uniref:hypothetical protein n=1 Tax=Priestia TaxID=2800373 RepID=UPI001FB2A11B|nr:hypothetical protein [Priestia filamentosa]MED3727910.1 hypothetical protein [Priestia filamentosa]UOE60216.1 hypothetical protein HPB58_23410 [Priestia filamentosa]